MNQIKMRKIDKNFEGYDQIIILHSQVGRIGSFKDLPWGVNITSGEINEYEYICNCDGMFEILDDSDLFMLMTEYEIVQ